MGIIVLVNSFLRRILVVLPFRHLRQPGESSDRGVRTDSLAPSRIPLLATAPVSRHPRHPTTCSFSERAISTMVHVKRYRSTSPAIPVTKDRSSLTTSMGDRRDKTGAA